MAADKKISELPVLPGLSANDVSVIVNNGTNYQFSISLLLQYINGNITSGNSIAFGLAWPPNTVGRNGDVFVKTDTGQFSQKIAGTWIVAYTPAPPVVGGISYGTGLPVLANGKNGDTYVDTLSGVFFQKRENTWSQVFSMQTGPQGPKGDKGETGTPGANGSTILSGSINPSNQLVGIDGDFYINTNSLTIFGPKTAGSWGSATHLASYSSNKIIPFIAGGDNPIIIDQWQERYYEEYGNGEFLVQLVDEDGNLQDRPDLSLKRHIDRSDSKPVQTQVSLDFPSYSNGQIIIKSSYTSII